MGITSGKEVPKDKAHKADKSHKSKPKHPNTVQPSNQESILKGCDTSSLTHALDDDVENYYDVTNKILGV